MQAKITSIEKRIRLMLSTSIRLGSGTVAYPTGPPTFANATKPLRVCDNAWRHDLIVHNAKDAAKSLAASNLPQTTQPGTTKNRPHDMLSESRTVNHLSIDTLSLFS
jgi:hypothetical protein